MNDKHEDNGGANLTSGTDINIGRDVAGHDIIHTTTNVVHIERGVLIIAVAALIIILVIVFFLTNQNPSPATYSERPSPLPSSTTGATSTSLTFSAIGPIFTPEVTSSTAKVSPAPLRTPVPAITVPPFATITANATMSPEARIPAPSSTGSGFGNVSFDELTKECNFEFNMYDSEGDKVVNEGKTRIGASVGAGTYDIGLLRYSGGWRLSGRYEFMRIENVNIQNGQNTVDLTQRIGAILVSSHPTFNTKELALNLYQAGTHVIHGGAVGGKSNELYCLPAGPYKIVPGAIGELAFNIVIEAGTKIDFAPDVWKHVGRLSFLTASDSYFEFQVYDQVTGDYISDAGWGSNFFGVGWFEAGTYRIVLTKPYPGTTYENVKITAGEETVLQLPSSP